MEGREGGGVEGGGVEDGGWRCGGWWVEVQRGGGVRVK